MRKGMWSAAALALLLSGMVLWGPTVEAAENRVAMNDQLKFDPATIEVQAGTAVVWQNDGYAQHDVKAKDGSFKSNGLLDKGQTFEFRFTTPGKYEYICSPHESAGMTGVVKVLEAGSAPAPTATTAAPTTTTAAAVPGQGATTTTTAKAAPGASSTTTTTAGTGVTSTTQAPSVTPTSGPDTAGETTTTTAAGASGEESAADHGSEGGAEHKDKKNSPIGIAFASVSTLLLAAIAGKLLASKP